MKKNTETTTTPNRPTHRVYAVKNTGGDKSHWTEIGAAWAHQEGRNRPRHRRARKTG